MILMESTLEGFAGKVRERGWKIVVYGFGVIGRVTVPAFLATNHWRTMFFVMWMGISISRGSRSLWGNDG